MGQIITGRYLNFPTNPSSPHTTPYNPLQPPPHNTMYRGKEGHSGWDLHCILKPPTAA